MTEQEFADAQEVILKDIPKAFHGWMSHRAWEQGHSCGYAEVLGCLSDMTDGFMEALNQYEASEKSG